MQLVLVQVLRNLSLLFLGEPKECVTVVIQSGFDWQLLSDLLDEGQIVLEFIDQQPTIHNQRPPTPDPVLFPNQFHAPTPVPSTQVLSPAPVTTDETEADTLDEGKQLMQVVAEKGLHNIKDIEKTITLYIMDTGGQPEFYEIIPLFLNGPALHLVFFNLIFSLDDPIPI